MPFPLTTLLLAVLVLLPQLAAPAEAQRRRRRAPAPAPAPRPRAVEAPPRPSPTPGAAAEATAVPTPAARHAGSEVPFESLLGADTYGVFAELRKVGQLSQNSELKMALAALRLSGQMPKEFNDLVSFVYEHDEALGEARYVLAMMPGRSGIPSGLSALEFPTVERAAAFEPKYRAFVKEQLKAFNDANTPPPSPPPARGRSGRGRPQPGAPKLPQLSLNLKRVGNCILLSAEPFTLKQLRGDGEVGLLADNARFQNMKARFASESLFVYVDTAAIQRGWAAQMELAQRQADEMQAAAQQTEVSPALSGEVGQGTAVDIGIAGPTITTSTTGTLTSETNAGPTPEPEATPDEDEERSNAATMAAPTIVAVDENGQPIEPPHVEATPHKPSEEEVASRQLSMLLRGLDSGIPRIPEAFAVAVALEGGTIVARAAVPNRPDGAVNIIPFLPNIFNGPSISSESAALAPADADVFISTSFDWTRIFGGLVAEANERAATMPAVAAAQPEALSPEFAFGDGGSLPSADAVVEMVEKLFGFKFKEDLLPTLGNEIAFSVPLKFFTAPGRDERIAGSKDEKEKEPEAEAGLVVIFTLNDPEKARKILPRVAMAFGMAAPGAPARTERREGFDIQALGSFSYVIINNQLAVAEDIKAVRHVVDAYAKRQTLEASNSFTDATEWQARQRVAQVFLSDALMKYAQDEAKKMGRASTDPLVLALLSQLEMPPEPASYVATNEGDVLLHEARIPLNFIKTYAVSIMISVKEAPVIGNESMARYALTAIVNAQEQFKNEKRKGRFGTLEELVREGLLEKWIVERQEYKIELTAAGEKFEATAVPLNYGKTGRRSFFVDETGVVRAADRQGKPATVEDPPVEDD